MSYPNYENIILEKRGHIGILTANRPEKLNAINIPLLVDFRNGMLELDKDKEVRAIVVRAAGTDFGSGHDNAYPWNSHEQEGDDLDALMDTIGKPVIGAWQGRAIGGSFIRLLYCDVLVASEDAKFRCIFMKRGLWSIKRLERMVGIRKAFEWVLCGDYISAVEAERYGFVNKIVPREKLDEAAIQMAERFAKRSPLGIRVSKEGLYQARDMGIRDSEAFLRTFADYRLSGSEDFKESTASLKQRRAPVYKDS